jgi:hypothetical protein
MGIEASAGLRAFVLSFRGHLFAAMSGSASVPFTIAAAFVENKFAQLLFFFCALTCAGLAAFRVWKPERERVMELENKIGPKLALSFHPEAEGLVQTPVVIRRQDPGAVTPIMQTTKSSYVRIRVEALSETTVTGCTAFLVGLEKSSAGDAFVAIQLPHAILLRDSFDVPPKVWRTVDFLTATEGQNKLAGASEGWPLSLLDAFNEVGTTYRCRLAVNGNGITSEIKVDVIWRGQWDQITAFEVKD